MSPRSWLISGLLLVHLMAIAGAAIPPPYADRASATHDPAASAVWDMLGQVHDAAWGLSSPWRRFGRAYIRRVALVQNWNMFGNPADNAQYVRVRYHLTSSRAATELIFPTHREDRIRLVQGLRDSFRDKAVSTALERFVANSNRTLQEAGRGRRLDMTRARALLARNPPDNLVPVVRFFGDRFAEAQLEPGEQILRHEVWYGLAPLPADAGAAQAARTSVLHRYYGGAILTPVDQYAAAPRYGATEREADIVWTLIYIHQP